MTPSPGSREEFLQGLTLDNGRITSPGKFEGELAYVPFYWDRALDGWADEEGEDGSVSFVVMPDERRMWPEVGSKRVVRLREDDNGFVRESL